MMFLCKRLGLGVGLILAASSILLLSDKQHWPGGAGGRVKHVAVLQHASVAVLDDGVTGAVAGLAEKGFHEGDNLRLTFFNAQGDVATASTIARSILNDPYDLVITMSTPSLQAVAGPNKDRRMHHVFGLVADPFSAGVGLDRDNPAVHPPYMVGQGIFLPVDESFRLARQLNPALKNVGVVWNPAESNSLAFTRAAREVCKTMGINLLEATVDNSAGVLEAAHSVIARGAQAIWVGGDVSVSSAIDTVVAAAESRHPRLLHHSGQTRPRHPFRRRRQFRGVRQIDRPPRRGYPQRHRPGHRAHPRRPATGAPPPGRQPPGPGGPFQ